MNGLAVPVPFGGIALTGNVRPVFNPTSLGCSATYCHGNFPGGKTAAVPVWNVPPTPAGTALACTACHNMPTTNTSRHSLHMGKTGMNCLNCHNGIATGTGNPSGNAAVTGPTLHVNGVKNVVFGGNFDNAHRHRHLQPDDP